MIPPKTIGSFLTLGIVSALLVIAAMPGLVLAHGANEGNAAMYIEAGKVPILNTLLSHNFPVTTKSPAAQEYFNQGLVLTYGFDHADAESSFLEAARLDPDCAMVYWGAALVLGPNINAPMAEASVSRAYALAQKALSLSGRVSPKERALTEALARRYAPEPVQDRSPLDRAFAQAMKGVYEQFSEDPDVAVLYAESLMDLHPWDYWTGEGLPQPWTPEIRTVLERTMARSPDHPHVHHLYIHLMENSPTPEVTVKSADVIGTLAPASGHLVHMAAHAYYAAGLYHDFSRANERAIGVDKTLTSAFDTTGLYRSGYVPHVLQFLLASYMMEGRSKDAVRVARTLSESINAGKMREPGGGTSQHFFLTPYYVAVRFGLWKDILDFAPPSKDLPYPLGMWHYARGVALVRTGRFDEARLELDALRTIAGDPSLEGVTIWDINKAGDILAIALQVLQGELAVAEGRSEAALVLLTRGVAMEEALTFDEPPPWYYPVRQSLGALLLDLGKPSEAESVFRVDLLKNGENPWSLFGLAESLKKQGKTDLLPDIEQRFRRAWSRSDVELKRPVF